MLKVVRRRGSTEKGAGLVARLMLVRIQSSALVCITRPRSVPDFARDPAKVVDQVRFLARTLSLARRASEGFRRRHIYYPRLRVGLVEKINVTLEPDGPAAACKAASSGFDSHRRLLLSKRLVPSGQRRAGSRISSILGVFRTWVVTREAFDAVSSEAEHQTITLAVVGSTPAPATAGLKNLHGRRESASARSPRKGDDRLDPLLASCDSFACGRQQH